MISVDKTIVDSTGSLLQCCDVVTEGAERRGGAVGERGAGRGSSQHDQH